MLKNLTPISKTSTYNPHKTNDLIIIFTKQLYILIQKSKISTNKHNNII